MDKGRKRIMGKRILITAYANVEEKIFKEFLFSINKLKISEDYTIDKFFILPKTFNPFYLNSEEYSFENKNFIKEENYKFYHWNAEKIIKPATYKTQLLEKARKEEYDYLFMLDAGILLHPNTLQHLLNLNLPIVTEAVYTKQFEKITLIDGEYEGCQYYKNRQYEPSKLYEINYGSLITLIDSSIFNMEGINYLPLEEVIEEPNEDWYFFCKIYCYFPDLKVYMDTTYLGRHLYDDFCYERWIKDKNNV